MRKRGIRQTSLAARLLGWGWRAFAVAAGLLLLYQLWFFAQVLWWQWSNPSSSAFMEDRLETLQDRNPKAQIRHQWVPYERISSHLKRAIVSAEDAKFLDHEGFDWDAIQQAYEKNLRKGRVVRGGSTISQQLAKNLFLSSQRTPWRKAQEAVITLMLEATWSKRRILEVYLNIIEWGNGVFGAEAAARHYFGTTAAGLSAEQAARLAAMVPNPRYFDRRRDSPYLYRRTEIILRRMNAAQIP